MLSKPADGWTEFRLGSEDTAYRMGFLTDVPIDWLNQAIHGLETMDAFSVHGFCEPGRMVCTVSYWNCYIIFEGNERDDICESVYTVHVSMIDFCRKLYEDISANVEDWAHWDDPFVGVSPGEGDGYKSMTQDLLVDERRAAILYRLDTLKQLIDQRTERFEEERGFF